MILGQGFTSIYQSADHYWPMKNISDNTSLDRVSYMHAEIMNGAKLNDTKLFGPAIIFDGEDDWIKLGECVFEIESKIVLNGSKNK
jgi:hypothetical protein